MASIANYKTEETNDTIMHDPATKKLGPPKLQKISPPEKVIFFLDEVFFSKKYQLQQRAMVDLLALYIDIKKKTAAKKTEFYLMIVTKGIQELMPLTESKEEIQDMFQQFMAFTQGKEQPYNLGSLFTSLAQKLDLPNPACYAEQGTAPPHVYHLILFFGHNFTVPYMDECQSFFFLADNPYFTLDILYLKSTKSDKNKTKEVAAALSSLINSEKEFFCEVELSHDISEVGFALNRLLGHSLIRSPKAMFNVSELNQCYSLL